MRPWIVLALALTACSVQAEGPESIDEDPAQAPSAVTSCITVQRGLTGSVVSDSFVNAASTTKNYGSNANVLTGSLSGAERRGLLRFELPALPPGATLSSATLSLVVWDNGGTGTVNVHRATSAWGESSVSWSTQPTFLTASAASATSTAPSFDLTSLVSAWYTGTPNHGVVLRQSPNYTNYVSSENVNAFARPKLVICYDAPPAASCDDGVKNGSETGVDCGGSCAGCDGDACAAAADCVSGVCGDGLCQPEGGESVVQVGGCALPVDPGVGGVNEAIDVPFTSTGVKLDVAWPLGGGTHPAVVLFHSGGWVAGDKQSRREDARALASQGYVVLNANYRLAPSTQSPGQQSDARCAVRFARANAAAYGIDPSRVYAVGLSSGGHLAQGLGADADLALDDGTCLVSGDHSVQKVAAWFGIPDLRTNAAVGSGALPFVEQFLGCQPDVCPATAALASPIAHLDWQDPPVLLSHATSDATVPYAQATAYRDAVRAAGVDATLVTYSGGMHGYSLFEANAHVPSSCTLLAFLAQP